MKDLHCIWLDCHYCRDGSHEDDEEASLDKVSVIKNGWFVVEKVLGNHDPDNNGTHYDDDVAGDDLFSEDCLLPCEQLLDLLLVDNCATVGGRVDRMEVSVTRREEKTRN